MRLDSLPPWWGSALAFVLALAWAGLARALSWPRAAALGAGVGLAAGWSVLLGLGPASPRQVIERLPLLVVAGAAAAGLLLALGGATRRGAAVVGVGLAILAAAWWLAGSPLTLADLRRAAVPLLALVLLLGGLQLALTGVVPGLVAAALLAGGVWIVAPPGPWLLLATALFAAIAGGSAAGQGWSVPARLPIALGLGALVAAPVMLRAGAANWLVAAAPVAALWLGPALAQRFGGPMATVLGWGLAGGAPLLLAWLLTALP